MGGGGGGRCQYSELNLKTKTWSKTKRPERALYDDTDAALQDIFIVLISYVYIRSLKLYTDTVIGLWGGGGGDINYFSMSGVLPLGNLCDFPPEWKFEVSLLAQWHLICSSVLVVLAFKF